MKKAHVVKCRIQVKNDIFVQINVEMVKFTMRKSERKYIFLDFLSAS